MKKELLRFDKQQNLITENVLRLFEDNGIAKPVKYFSQLIATYCVDYVKEYPQQAQFKFDIPEWWFTQNKASQSYLFFTNVKFSVEISIEKELSMTEISGYKPFIEQDGKYAFASLYEGKITNASIIIRYRGPKNKMYDDIIESCFHELTHLYGDYQTLCNGGKIIIDTQLYGTIKNPDNQVKNEFIKSIPSHYKDSFEITQKMIDDAFYAYSKPEGNAFTAQTYQTARNILQKNMDSTVEDIIFSIPYWKVLTKSLGNIDIIESNSSTDFQPYIKKYLEIIFNKKFKTFQESINAIRNWALNRWENYIYPQLQRIIEIVKMELYNETQSNQ